MPTGLFDARAVIEAVRDRRATVEGVAAFAAGLADGRVTDAQAGAFAMAVLLNGVSEEVRVALTRAMRDSGDVMRWDLPGPAIDKHSTGGVGDSISLLLAPALAECGVKVRDINADVAVRRGLLESWQRFSTTNGDVQSR